MADCIFCQIVAGKSPCYKIYEDDRFFAFLDINPNVAGHTLIIPKIHYRWVYEVPDFAEYWQVVLKITRAIQKSLKPKWINYFTYGVIPHAHIHLFPRDENIGLLGFDGIIPGKIKVEGKQLEEIAKKITSEFKN